MPRSSPVVRVLDGLLEFCWLFALFAVPIFFNVRDYRTFEPDKITVLRNTVLVMVALVLLKALYIAPYYFARWFGSRSSPASASLAVDLQDGLRKRPIVIAALVFAFVYLLATITSIEPRISFWGSFDRAEGAYTYFTYITLFLIAAGTIRTWAQIERVVTAIILASVPVAAYSWLQHFHNDPMVWANSDQTALRTPSTMGNPIFLAAALLMAVPFTLYRLVLGVDRVLRLDPEESSGLAQVWSALGTAGYAGALGLQLGAIGFSGSRGPALGLLAAIIVFGLCLAVARHIGWLTRIMVALALLLALVFGATNTVLRSADTPGAGFSRFLHLLPSESGSSEVRSLLWKSAGGLFKEHPLLGCGPEVLLFCWYQHYPPELRQVEQANAAPDRSHDEEIDILLTTGLLGELAYLAFLGTAIVVMIRLLRMARDLRAIALVCALIGAFIGHIVEGVTGIAFSTTLLLLWTVAALATSLYAGTGPELAAAFGATVPEAEPEPERTPPATARRSGSTPNVQSRRATRGRPQQRGGPAQPSRRTAERGSRYVMGMALQSLKGGALSLWTVGIVAFVAMLGLCVALFVYNIQVIAADADYRYALNLEQESGQLVTQQSTYQQGLAGYQLSIAAYQSSLDSLPTWNLPPPQDTYSLFYGKTLLEYAAALLIDKSNANSQTEAVGAIQQALTVFTNAMQANALNPDHPRNIAKLYEFWAQNLYSPPSIEKYTLADQYYGKASSLAPHNADILDEWAHLDLELGTQDTKNTHQWYDKARNHLLVAEGLYPEDGSVYRDLGTVYGQYAAWAEQGGDTAGAKRLYRQQVDTWLLALKYAATDYQLIYPPLARVYRLKLNDPCSAGQYATFALQHLTASPQIPDPDGSVKLTMQQLVQDATNHGCHLVTQ